MTSKSKKGTPPGTLIYTGKHKNQPIKIETTTYNKSKFKEEKTVVQKIRKSISNKTVTWINIIGIHNSKVVEYIGKEFSINPLILEDILSTNQRPKYELLDKHLYLVLNIIHYKPHKNIDTEQISIIQGKNYVITFQERDNKILDPLKERIAKDNGKIRKMGADYLAYSIVDTIVDNYYQVLEELGEELEKTEVKITKDAKQEDQQKLNQTKRELIKIRKSIWPLREMISGIQRLETRLISKNLKMYFKDLHDHIIQAIDTLETYRDTAHTMSELYMSSMSNKMNEIMKVLTIFSAIFIPLTFITGIYGMNFKYMYELHWEYGYLYAIGIMLVIGVSMLIFFKKKKWM